MRESIHQADEDAIFEAALQLADPAQRREFLDRAFHGDLQGRRGIEELLEMATDASRYFCDARRSVAVLARQVLEDIPAGIFDCHLPFTDVRRNERAVASQGKIAATHFPDMTGWQVATSRICPCRWLPQAP